MPGENESKDHDCLFIAHDMAVRLIDVRRTNRGLIEKALTIETKFDYYFK